MGKLMFGDRRLMYLDTAEGLEGSALAAAAPVLVLLHAFPLNAKMWEPQLTAVPEGWRVIAPHFRGFGGSDADLTGQTGGGAADAGHAPPEVTLDDYAGDVVTLLDDLHVDRAVVGGLSMGGYVAFALLRLAASRVAALVLADTKAEGDSEEAQQGRLEMAALARRAGVPAVVDRLMPRLLSERTRREQPEVERRVRAMAEANSADAVAAALVRMMRRPDSTDLLPRLDCPTLVVAGSDDIVTPPEQSRRLSHSIAGSRLVEIPHAGHLSNMEQPQAFNAALSQFLASL